MANFNQAKLTIPFARRRKAGVQRKIAGRVKNIKIINKIEEIKSIALKGSPVKMNIPLSKRRPEQKSMNCK